MMNTRKVALITGASKRIGATIAKTLHDSGYNVIIHYGNSKKQALELAEGLNRQRDNSAICLQGDLLSITSITAFAEKAVSAWGGIDVLINNASSFYPTPIESATEKDWDDLVGSNLKGPFFLTQQLTTTLKAKRGSIVNIIDIHADKPLTNHPIYCMAKAGLAMMTKSLAKDLAPDIRVNGVSPGAILWPETEAESQAKSAILAKIPLTTIGETSDIAKAVKFLVADAPYITGQILAIDGGRSLTM
ncbi:MAG: pteridine reductase [Oceanicoccus sp.]|jgi:pteridine reductase